MDYSKFDDGALIRLITQGHEPALGELYERYGRLVFSIATNSISDADLAEEITQDVFLRVWKRADTYVAGYGKVVTWLARIARNRAIDVIRQQNVRPEGHSISWAEVMENTLPDSQSVEADFDLTQRQQAVRLAIAQLPEEQQRALALAYFKGYSHQQIADELGEPLGTVKTRIRLGMQKLSQSLTEFTSVDKSNYR
jgi:RNA polymerase sigma-70 factor (ECF subfamily)